MDGRQPKTNWLTAALAAAAWICVAVAALWLMAPVIVADLQTRSEAALQAAHFDGVAVAMDGRTATLSGYVEDDRQRADALAAVDGVWGVGSVVDAMQSGGSAAAPDLYRFGAVWDGKTLSLTGFMPSRDGRGETVQFARDTFSGAEVLDGLQVALGAPDANWQAIAAAGLAAMKPLASATLSIAGTRVTFKGVAIKAADRASSVDIISRLPAPYETSIDITYGTGETPLATPSAVQEPGYIFGAAYDGESVALTGTVPSKAVQGDLKTALAEALPGTKIDDRSKPAPGAPDGAWGDAVALVLREFAGMKAATLTLDGRSLSFNAMAPTDKARQQTFAALADLPAGYSAVLEIAVAGGTTERRDPPAEPTPAAACQAGLQASLSETPIVFASSSAKVPEAAEPLIAKMADIARTCPSARLEIAGHTDASGNAATNIRLSFQRAEAVEAALMIAGIDGGRLTAKGYGAARPVAANDNDDGKSRNRRIEVIVRP